MHEALGECMPPQSVKGSPTAQSAHFAPTHGRGRTARRKTNVETLEHALREQGYAPHITAQMLLFILNNVTYMTYVTGRKVNRDDYVALIAQLLLPATP